MESTRLFEHNTGLAPAPNTSKGSVLRSVRRRLGRRWGRKRGQLGRMYFGRGRLRLGLTPDQRRRIHARNTSRHHGG
jgi:hypothetical protein